jgi:hypothetical protein
MCVLLSLLLFGPRGAILIWWLFWPARWELAFDSFIVPFIGWLFLPFTTMVYVLVAPGGVEGFDYLWLTISVFLDIASYGGGGAYQRGRQGAGYN